MCRVPRLAASSVLQVLLLLLVCLSAVEHWQRSAALVVHGAEIPTRFHRSNQKRNDEAYPAEVQPISHGAAGNDVEHDKMLNSIQNYHDADPDFSENSLYNVTNMAEFIRLFANPDTMDAQFNGRRKIKRSAESGAIQAREATCQLENEIVHFEQISNTNDPNVQFFPKCTRVKRCSGCCNKLMSCQPLTTKFTTFKVNKQFRDEKAEPVNLIVEEHTSCQCKCIVKEEDCNFKQTYNRGTCKCDCRNTDAESKCNEKDPTTGLETKIWNTTTCNCMCKETQPCTTGTIFDEDKCHCVDDSNSENRKFLIVNATPVDPDNNTPTPIQTRNERKMGCGFFNWFSTC